MSGIQSFTKLKLFNSTSADASDHAFELHQQSALNNETVDIRCRGPLLRFFTNASTDAIMELDTANNTITIKGDLCVTN
jgi:hypothetical protein